jgi:hypothetical protein
MIGTVASFGKESPLLVLGVAVDAKKDAKRPAIHAVLAEVTEGGSASIVDAVDHSGDDEPMPDQLHHAAEWMRTYLKSVRPDRVVVRQADFHPQARLTDGRTNRLLVEGAITSAATSVVPDTRLASGKEAGEWFGGQKADVENAAKALVEGSPHHKRFIEAASAALAGISLGP